VLSQDPGSIKRLIFCVGKIYYELDKARSELPEEDRHKIAIVRIEQVTPFPFDLVAEQVAHYANAEMVFVQEEPKNMGTWYFVDDRIYTATRVLLDGEDGRRCAYVGRKTMASPAVGFGSVHTREQDNILRRALDISKPVEDLSTPKHSR
jgi:2-oxoglutarate dehydrogenase E1 component